MTALAAASFVAPGHCLNLINHFTQIIHFIQTDHLSQARIHLAAIIERTDGCVQSDEPDPMRARQPFARDYLVECADQIILYELLSAALDALVETGPAERE